MFNNVGRKIKDFAQIFYLLEIVGLTIIGFIVIADDAPIGFLIIVGGGAFSWLSNLVLYGFGELVENCDAITEYIEHNSLGKDINEEEKNAETPESSNNIQDSEEESEEFLLYAEDGTFIVCKNEEIMEKTEN